MTRRQEKITAQLVKLAGEFFARESDRTSMLTITRAEIGTDFKNATLYLSVYPQDAEPKALDFARRKRTELRNYIKEKTRMKMLPILDIVIDSGEKNRQHIETLIEQDKLLDQ